MTISIRRADRGDLDAIVALAVDAQSDPNRFCAYLGEDASSIAAEVVGLAGRGGGEWTAAAWVAVDDFRGIVASLLAETDPESGRVWWWGPFVGDAPQLAVHLRACTVDGLFAAAMDVVGDCSQYEMVADERSAMLASFGRRHGFVADAASAVLRTHPFATSEWAGDAGVVAIDVRHHASVSELHDELFPGTHTTGENVVESDPDKVRLVIEDDETSTQPTGSRVCGYVATEAQSDGSLYVDFLGVAPDRRGRGFGRRLVAEAMRHGAERGLGHAHLTVRADNVSARRLYASLGFVEERIVVPFRRGFSLG